MIFQVVSEVKGQQLAQNYKKFCLLHSISQESYIIWSSFVVHKSKMIIPPGVFFLIFQNFDFLLLGGSKGKKWPIMIKNSVRHALYLRNHTSYECEFCYTCVKWWYLQMFFSFCSELIFRVVWRVKGQKMMQKDKKLCLSQSISQYPYLIQLCFLLHMSNVDVFNNFFFIFFKILILGVFRWGSKRAKNGP